MWEAIEANQRRSAWLIGLLTLLLVLIGATLGLLIADWLYTPHSVLLGRTAERPAESPADGRHLMLPERSPDESTETGSPLLDELWAVRFGAYYGAGIALLIAGIMWLTATSAGDQILLRTAGAREIEKEDAPQLWNVVEEMTIASGLSHPPRVFIIDDPSPNAFAVGRNPERAAIAVTAGLLKQLNRDELQGVVAHEIGHIVNQDARFLTLAAVMLGAIVLIAEIFLRSLRFGGGGRRSSSRGGGQAAVILFVAMLVLALLAPLMAQLLYYACSRRREYLADASGARFTRYPEGLASALEKISRQAGASVAFNRVTAPLCIVNPLHGAAALSLFATHPRTEERVQILRGMHGAGYAEYESAFRKLHGEQAACVGARTLSAAEEVPLRAPLAAEVSAGERVAQAQAVGTLLERALPCVVIPCPCGARLRLPPGFRKPRLKCPRCGQEHTVPRATAVTVAAMGAAPAIAAVLAGASAKKAPATGAGAPPATQPPGASAAGSGTAAAGSGSGAAAAPGVAGPPAPPKGPRVLAYQRRADGWESFHCGCGHPVQISPKFSGRFVVCPQCKARITVLPTDGAQA